MSTEPTALDALRALRDAARAERDRGPRDYVERTTLNVLADRAEVAVAALTPQRDWTQHNPAPRTNCQYEQSSGAQCVNPLHYKLAPPQAPAVQAGTASRSRGGSWGDGIHDGAQPQAEARQVGELEALRWGASNERNSQGELMDDVVTWDKLVGAIDRGIGQRDQHAGETLERHAFRSALGNESSTDPGSACFWPGCSRCRDQHAASKGGSDGLDDVRTRVPDWSGDSDRGGVAGAAQPAAVDSPVVTGQGAGPYRVEIYVGTSSPVVVGPDGLDVDLIDAEEWELCDALNVAYAAGAASREATAAPAQAAPVAAQGMSCTCIVTRDCPLHAMENWRDHEAAQPAAASALPVLKRYAPHQSIARWMQYDAEGNWCDAADAHAHYGAQIAALSSPCPHCGRGRA